MDGLWRSVLFLNSFTPSVFLFFQCQTLDYLLDNQTFDIYWFYSLHLTSFVSPQIYRETIGFVSVFILCFWRYYVGNS
jgi:hypothetical protein